MQRFPSLGGRISDQDPLFAVYKHWGEKLHANLLIESQINPLGFMVWAILAHYRTSAGAKFVLLKQVQIALTTGSYARSVRRELRRLEAFGLVRTRRVLKGESLSNRYGARDIRRTCNAYEVCLDPRHTFPVDAEKVRRVFGFPPMDPFPGLPPELSPDAWALGEELGRPGEGGVHTPPNEGWGDESSEDLEEDRVRVREEAPERDRVGDLGPDLGPTKEISELNSSGSIRSSRPVDELTVGKADGSPMAPQAIQGDPPGPPRVGAGTLIEAEPTQAKGDPPAAPSEGPWGEKSKPRAPSPTARDLAAHRCAHTYAVHMLGDGDFADAFVRDAKIALSELAAQMPLETAEKLLKAAVHGALVSPHNQTKKSRLPSLIWSPKAARALAALHLQGVAKREGGELTEAPMGPPPPSGPKAPPESAVRVKVASPRDPQTPQRSRGTGPRTVFEVMGGTPAHPPPPKAQNGPVMEVRTLLARAESILENGELGPFEELKLQGLIGELRAYPESIEAAEGLRAFCAVYGAPKAPHEKEPAPSELLSSGAPAKVLHS